MDSYRKQSAWVEKKRIKCDRCQEFCKNFKRVSNGKPGR